MSPPHVTVVIPAYHSEALIGECLESLTVQTYTDFEVVVVNSSAPEPTRELVSNSMPAATFVQSAERLFPHDARAAGIRLARGSFIAFIDPDCRAAPDWLETLVGRAETGERAVAGSVAPNPGASEFELAAFVCKQRFLLPGPPGRLRWAPTANLLVERSAYETSGGFPPHLFAGDVVLGERLVRIGIWTCFEPAARVEHRYDGARVEFLRERLLRGLEYGRVRPGLAGWSSARRLAHAAVMPLTALRLVERTIRAAARAGLELGVAGRLWVVAGQASWAFGEAIGYASPDASDRQAQ